MSETQWVDSVFSKMSTEEKIGQLFMIRAFSKNDKVENDKIVNLIKQYHVGGICFFQGSPEKQAELTNKYQALARIPMLISIDGESGLGMRFPESAIKFPKQITLGAVANEDLIYNMGKSIAWQCKRLGVHMNFAPVVDINNNANNPVINDRSFGEEKYIVTAKAMAYMRGLQDHGLIATAKHFPGHGDTDVDSHFDLPVINHSTGRIHDTELVPFKAMINQGVYSIMIGHLYFPSLDNAADKSAALSQKIVTDLLRNELGYNGLIITDAMDMKGVAKRFSAGVAEAEAFMAGNDMILLPDDIVMAVSTIRKYLEEGKIFPSQLDESIKRILSVKYKAGLHQYAPIQLSNLMNEINNNRAKALKAEIIESALTLVTDDYNAIPLQSDKKYMSIAIGELAENDFQKRLSSFAEVIHYNVKKEITIAEKNRLLQAAKKHEYIIISTHDMSRQAIKRYGITNSTVDLIESLSAENKVILNIFGNPYSLQYFSNAPTILMCYEDDEMFQDLAAQALFGAIKINGTLPVSASSVHHYTSGISKNNNGILGFAIPERVNLSSEKLSKIDQIASEIISKKAAPGCVILIAKDNKIVYHKAFGKHTYNSQKQMVKDDVFDVASLTKILSGTLAIMKLQDEGRLNVESTMSVYLPELLNSNKSHLVLSDVMAHHGSLIPFIPFYESTIAKWKGKVTLKPEIYSTYLKNDYTIPVAQRMFMKDSYADTIWNKIIHSELRSSDSYKYSDLGFYFVKRIVENASNRKFDKYVEEEYYKPLRLKYTMYNPQSKIGLNKIVPSEVDNYWRGQTVHGTVHDMGAAMLGGVSGHAGLFSNANEIAVIMQMLLNKGKYGHKEFLSPNTVDYFTKRHYKSSRRAIGFDMKDLSKSDEDGNMSFLASNDTFGHTGFTGTCAYADPKHNLIYIFLSNRTFPDMNNNALHKQDYRHKIQSLIYEAME